MCLQLLLLLLLVLPGPVRIGAAASAEGRLLTELLARSDRRQRPVARAADNVTVSVHVTLQQVQLEAAVGQASLGLWLNFGWTNPELRWEPSEYGDVHRLLLRPADVWMPDVEPHSHLLLPDHSIGAANDADCLYTGEMSVSVPVAVRVPCQTNYWAGEDRALCQLSLGSQRYYSFEMDITEPTLRTRDAALTRPWVLRNASLSREVVMFVTGDSVELRLELELRRPTAHSVRSGLPALASLLCSLASFLVPVDSPQKLTLPGLSVLAAGCAVISEPTSNGSAQYQEHVLRGQRACAYQALAVLIWSVLAVRLGRRRTARLPARLRRLLPAGRLSAACCLPAAGQSAEDDKLASHEWTALAELLDRLALVVYIVVSTALLATDG